MVNRVFLLGLMIAMVCPLASPGQTPCRDDISFLYPDHYYIPLGNDYNTRYTAIASRNGFAYVVNKGSWSTSNPVLRCLELGNGPYRTPVVRGTQGLPTAPTSILLKDNFAIMPMGSLGISVMDISDPDNLGLPVTTLAYDTCRDVALHGDDHLVAAEWSALRIYDLQNPLVPVDIGGVSLPQARTVAVSENLAFVACGNLGLAIVDITDPTAPSLVTQFPVGGLVDQVAATGKTVYLTGYLIDLVVVDVSTPTAPTIVDIVPLEGKPEAIVLHGGYAYITVGEAVDVFGDPPLFDSLAVVRLNGAETPVVKETRFQSPDFSSLAIGSDMVLMGETEGSASLFLSPLQCPDVSDVPGAPVSEIILSLPHPNPFNPRVGLNFTLPVGVPGRLAVHDMRGRLVATIWRGEGNGKETNVTWSGMDQTGQTCSSGTYAFILSDQTGRQAARVTGTLLR